ncbi:MAG: hypothetical protein VX498_13095, partial [Myxococcota bacterium]|nr:hypothetical protein [Myxococcota bacterium]
MRSPLLSALLALVLLVGCSVIEPDSFVGSIEMPGSRLEGQVVVARWTADPFPWEVRVPIGDEQLVASPGGSWSAPFTAEIDLSRWTEGHGEATEIIVAVVADWRHDAEGYYRTGPHTFSVSSNFTTTGIPIERSDGWPHLRLIHGKDGSPFEAISVHPLDGVDRELPLTLSGTLKAELPSDLPTGWYEPQVHVLVRVAGVTNPVHLAEFSYEWNDWAPGVLPLVRAGDPETIRLPWALLSEYPQAGRVGTFPRELDRRVGQVGRAGFISALALRPGSYELNPSMPTLYPRDSIARVDGGDDVQTERLDHFLRFDQSSVTARIRGPGEEVYRDLGSRRFTDPDSNSGPGEEPNQRPELLPGPYRVALDQTGEWSVIVEGELVDAFGRPVLAGGTYDFVVAHNLSFSTSCKPGTSFLVGDSYPAKVNVNPPFPAEVEVIVDWFPNSDPERKVRWVGKGRANAHGHFVPYGTPPLRFEEPGEYVSYVTARYTDARGELWMNRQTSGGVVAPQEIGSIQLHGTRSFPWIDYDFSGAAKQFRDRQQVENSYLPQTNLLLQDPFVPYNPEDTLVMPV